MITSSSFAGNDELVAVEDSIDVGNVLWIFFDCLSEVLLICGRNEVREKKKGGVEGSLPTHSPILL